MTNSYTGDKTIAKLVILEKYLRPYIDILREHWNQDLWYVDTHAGTGVTEIPDYRLNVKGSPIRALDFDFDSYYLYELKKNHWKSLCDAVEDHLQVELEYDTLDETGTEYAIQREDPRILIHNMDCNEGVRWLVDEGNPQKHWFTFVDPQELSAEWDLLKQLIDRGNTDILYNFQTSGIVRNSTEGAEHAYEALEQSLGEDVPKDESQDYYVNWFRENKIEPLGYHTESRKMTSRGDSSWRYDLIFASGNEMAVNRLMSDIMNNEEKLREDIVDEIEETRNRAEDPQSQFDSHLRFEEHDEESSQAGLGEFI